MYYYMTFSGYIIMIIVDSCILWFHLDCIMQLKKSYYTATNVSSRKSATTFGDLLDWFVWVVVGKFSQHFVERVIKIKRYRDLLIRFAGFWLIINRSENCYVRP